MNVVQTTSSNDAMLHKGDTRHYFNVGASAIIQIDAALRKAGNPEVANLLDLPCGHGRVARWLRARFPDAKLYVSDISEDGSAFCAETFGATTLPPGKDFDAISYGRTFDLIWVGSLITHLCRVDAVKLLRFLLRHLSARGIAVVSSHGALVVGRSQAAYLAKQGAYGLDLPGTKKALKNHFRKGFGYADYPGQTGYGISYIDRMWLEATLLKKGGKLLLYREHAWDNHHDIVAFRRRRSLVPHNLVNRLGRFQRSFLAQSPLAP